MDIIGLDLHKRESQLSMKAEDGTIFAAKEFNRARNIEAACELYLSDAVRSQMDSVRSAIARLSIVVEREKDRDPQESEKKEAMLAAIRELFRVMRKEMADEFREPAS